MNCVGFAAEIVLCKSCAFAKRLEAVELLRKSFLADESGYNGTVAACIGIDLQTVSGDNRPTASKFK